MARVVLENLTKHFPAPRGRVIRAVDQVNLTVESGEFFVLLGPSGCGKTTTLRLIAGLEESSAGTIWLDGKDQRGVSPKDRDVAMVFQNHALYPHLSVYDNLALGLRLRRVPSREIENRVGEAARQLGLEDCLESLPKELSGGQRQRVALGRALARRAKLMLLDEPLSNLDAPMRVQMRAELARLQSQLGTTMIYVTHDQVEAMTLGKRIGIMKNGRIQQVDSPMSIYHQPANRFVAGFIGFPPMNFFEGLLARRNGLLTFEMAGAAPGESRFECGGKERLKEWEGKRISLGVRPQSLEAVGSAEAQLEGRVEFIERLGAETLVHAVTGGQKFVMAAAGDIEMRVGDPIGFKFDAGRAHFFDLETGLAIH